MLDTLFDLHDLLGVDGPRIIATLEGPGVTVTVTCEDAWFGPPKDPTKRPAFVVTSTSGYRAVLPECPCQLDVPWRTPCDSAYGHTVAGKARDRDEHNRLHCHDWHQGSARRFAREVMDTYGTGTWQLPAPPGLSLVGGQVDYDWTDERTGVAHHYPRLVGWKCSTHGRVCNPFK